MDASKQSSNSLHLSLSCIIYNLHIIVPINAILSPVSLLSLTSYATDLLPRFLKSLSLALCHPRRERKKRKHGESKANINKKEEESSHSLFSYLFVSIFTVKLITLNFYLYDLHLTLKPFNVQITPSSSNSRIYLSTSFRSFRNL